MAPAPTPVVCDTQLPDTAAAVVIGGGIAGVSTALELAERGVDVIVCEKGEIGAEQSSRNWGWCRQMGRDPREIPLVLESLRLWRAMNARVGAETGFSECGVLYLCPDEAALARHERWLDEHARPYQVQSRIITARQAAVLAPGSARAWKGALYTPGDGRAEPQLAASAIAEAARAAGARVFTRCAVRGLETEAGCVARVVTEKGAVKCTTAILAGGVWSRHFCASIGLRLPQLMVASTAFRTTALDLPLEASARGSGFAYRKRLDGGYTIAHGDISTAEILPASFRYFSDFLPVLKADWTRLKLRLGRQFVDEMMRPARWPLDGVSPFERIRVMDPKPDKSVLNAARINLIKAFPAFGALKIAESWAGMIDATPDAVPVISAVDEHPGLFLATGFSGHGFGIGPGAGKLMADLVTGARPVVDPAPFRYTRFTDGSKLKVIAGL